MVGLKDAFSRDGAITIRMAPAKPSDRDYYYRITSEDELKTFCSKHKLDVNEECLPIKKKTPKSSASTMKAGGSATHGAAATPMDLHETSNLDPDAATFQSASNIDAETTDKPNP